METNGARKVNFAQLQKLPGTVRFLKRKNNRNAPVFRGKHRRRCYASGVNPCPILAVLAAIILGVGEIAAPLSTCHAGVPVNVTLDPQTPGAAIPADFLGLSFEIQRVLADTNGNHFFSAKNKNLIATFKTLGIKKPPLGRQHC